MSISYQAISTNNARGLEVRHGAGIRRAKVLILAGAGSHRVTRPLIDPAFHRAGAP